MDVTSSGMPRITKESVTKFFHEESLISIDYTYDFVADDGKLTAGAPAQAISDAIYEATKCAF